MSFDTHYRYIAARPEVIAEIYQGLMDRFAEPLPDAGETIPAIAAHWDNDLQTIVRAASLEVGSAAPIPLTDGRIAFAALWNSNLLAAFESGELDPRLQELTKEQLGELSFPEKSEP